MASGATTRMQRAVGSSTWIAAEKENIQQLVNQEMDEIEYPAQNEMDWLNEHMAEIFSRNQFNVTEIFKTPGKLRGKTPRTARKHKTPREARVPLSDIFSAQQNVRNSPAPPSRFHQEITKLASKPSPKEQPKHSSPDQYHQTKQPTYNTDSGYHGMPDDDDEMDLVYSEPHKDSEPESKSPESESNHNTQQALEPEPDRKPEHESEPEHEHVETATQPLDDSTIVIPRDRNDLSPSVDRRTTDASFHSAREIAPSKESTVEPMDIEPYESTPIAAPKQAATTAHLESPREPAHALERLDSTPLEKANEMEVETHEHDAALDHHFDDIGSPSDGSTPDRPPIRKSSLSFASLPAREPIKTKRSMGGHRISRISHIDPSKSVQGGYYGRQTGGARMTQILPEEHTEQGNIEGNTKAAESRAPPLLPEESELAMKGTNTYNKTSTQLLHEKINMLGKSQPSRGTKSIAATAPSANSQVQYPELPPQEPAADKPRRPSPTEAQTNDSRTAPPRSPQHFQSSHFVRDMTSQSPEQLRRIAAQEDRISRIMYSRSPERRSPAAKPFGGTGAFHAKSASTSIITSPRANTIGHQRTKSTRETVTPVSSPRRDDGPLSASKSRLQSIMKTAKGLFTSTGSVSAAAKMEALSSSPTSTRSQTGLYRNVQEIFSQEPQPPAIQSPPLQEGRRTRRSTEREEKRKEKERQEMQRMEEQLQKSREQEIQRPGTVNVAPEHRPPPKSVGTTPARETLATRSSPRRPPTQQSVREPEQSREVEHKFAVPAKPHHQSKQNDGRRPVRPTRDIQKPKPQPVSIRVGTLSQRIPLSNSSLSSSVQEPTPNPTPASKAPAPGVNKKGSKLSMQTNSSTSSFKSATSTSSKSKAVQAAEKKKEVSQRKRAAHQEEVRRQEEARRQEQASRAEAERRERERSVADDPKKLAHKQAIEKRRLENARKLEQQRNQQPTPANDLGSILQQEKAVLQGSQRNDLPSTRPSRLNSIQGQVRPVNYPPPNPAKPPKRALEDESSGRPVTGKIGAAVHQADGKRRKTDDEIAVAEPPLRSAMAPPIRQSNVRKEAPKQQMYNQGYSTMPPPPPHHQAGPSLFKNPTAPRHFQPGAPMQSQPHRNGHPLEMSKFASGKIPFADNSNPPPHASTHKTPAHGSQKILKSSPAYPNGDSIKLPEILTDSEDEDSDAEPYNVPDWAKPENLNNILISQEGRDGEQVFGPSAPLHMEEIFKDNKDRFKRFRDRTSSANWGGPDGLTQDEIKWDLAERERLKKNGGWTFTSS
ncbi:hypothetical protein GX51_06121 [Blastomyces parvus]|uniref:Inner centromere protein ARK-binding domain-containing protein n=1 Tax=Blastomyces parvus TaxID=2060905 RepID=A0A2B7WTA3_9EURO|nr:hypothetical protein GX51_06121 [Blastomyces parvus]